MAIDQILPFLNKCNTRLTWLALLFLAGFLISLAHLNFNYRPLSPAPKPASVSYYHPGEPLALPNDITHSSKYNELAKAPVKIFIPPHDTPSDPLVDIWDSLYHKAKEAAEESPKDKDAYFRALHCPVCPDSTTSSSSKAKAKAGTGSAKCPDFKQMLKNVAAQECSKCPFDSFKCASKSSDSPLVDGDGDGDGAALSPNNHPSARPLISYVYHESPTSYENLAFFVTHALHDAADFVFILYGNTTVDEDILPKGHVNINIYKNPALPSPCHPLAAHFEILKGNGGTPLKDVYERFILMSSEIRGPFIPRWSTSCWSEAFLHLVNENTKLVGTELSCMRGQRPHLHHHLLATDKPGLAALMEQSLASPDPSSAPSNTSCNAWEQIKAEKFITDTIRAKGWETAVLDMAFKDASQYRYVTCVDDVKTFVGTGASTTEQKDEGVDPWEVLFVDAGAGADQGRKRIESLSKKVRAIEYSSYDACRVGVRKPLKV